MPIIKQGSWAWLPELPPCLCSSLFMLSFYLTCFLMLTLVVFVSVIYSCVKREWGTMVICTQQMKRKTSEAHAT